MQTQTQKSDTVAALNELLRGEMAAVETYAQALKALREMPSPELERARTSHEERVAGAVLFSIPEDADMLNTRRVEELIREEASEHPTRTVLGALVIGYVLGRSRLGPILMSAGLRVAAVSVVVPVIRELLRARRGGELEAQEGEPVTH
jgi:hypothetical protein